jgi:hypothetical protein
MFCRTVLNTDTVLVNSDQCTTIFVVVQNVIGSLFAMTDVVVTAGGRLSVGLALVPLSLLFKATVSLTLYVSNCPVQTA